MTFGVLDPNPTRTSALREERTMCLAIATVAQPVLPDDVGVAAEREVGDIVGIGR